MLVEYPNSHFLFLRFISTKNFSTPFSNSSTETFVGMSSCFIYYKIPWLNVIMSRMNPHSIVCLNVKELLAQSRRQIWSLSDCNWTRTHNHLVHKQTLNHLAKLTKWLSCVVSTYLYGAFDCMLLSCHVRVSVWNYYL